MKFVFIFQLIVILKNHWRQASEILYVVHYKHTYKFCTKCSLYANNCKDGHDAKLLRLLLKFNVTGMCSRKKYVQKLTSKLYNYYFIVLTSHTAQTEEAEAEADLTCVSEAPTSMFTYLKYDYLRGNYNLPTSAQQTQICKHSHEQSLVRMKLC